MATVCAPAPPSTRRRWASLVVLVGAVLLLAIDGTVLYLAIPSLARELAPSATQVLWIGDVYSLALAGLLVTMGNVADRIGRKRLLLIGITGFGAASAVAAFAQTAEALIAARALLGVAGATLMPSTLSIIRTVFTDGRERARAIAIWSAASGGGVALGPLVGGVLLEHFWWGSVFLINVPVTAVLLVTGLVLLPESRNPERSRFDLASAGLSVAAMTPALYSVKHLLADGWDATVLVSAALAVAAGTAFVRRQRRSVDPLVDVALFRNPAFSGAVLANFIAIFALTGLLYFFSQYLQLVRGFPPLRAGLAELPATLASIGAVALVGVAASRLGHGRAIAAGLLATALGLLMVPLAEPQDGFVWLALALLPVGLGVGLAMTLTVDAVVSAVPSGKAGAASAISETAYELGVALGIAVLGSVTTLAYRTFLTLPADLSESTREPIEDSLGSALAVVGQHSPVAEAAREAFATAMQTTSIVAAVITVLAVWVSWRWIPARPTGDTEGTGHPAQAVDPVGAC